MMVNSEYYNTRERQKVRFFGFCEDEIRINRSREQREYAIVIQNMRQRNERLTMIQFLGGIKWYLLKWKGKNCWEKEIRIHSHWTQILYIRTLRERDLQRYHSAVGFSCGNTNRLLFTPDRTPNKKPKSQFYQSSVQGTSTYLQSTSKVINSIDVSN